MVDKLSLLSNNFSKLSSHKEREKIGDSFWFDKNDLVCLVCCSWWPDSLFLAVFVYRYRHVVKWLPLSITKILHFNHMSHDCDQEASRLVELLFWSTLEIIYWKTESWSKKITETVLRKQRQKFYTNSLQKFYNPLQSVALCLWHHYNDRIENSILHIDRGAWVKWILNMSRQEKKWFFDNWILLPFTVARPFLTYTKESILSFCSQIQLPFVVDVHNSDLSQKRILLRNALAKKSQEEKNIFYSDRFFVYSYLENKKQEECFFSVTTSPFWPTKQLYCTQKPHCIEQVQQLLSRCGVYSNISTSRLQNLLHSFALAQSFYMRWRWFLQWKWKTFFCFTWSKNRFWEEVIDDSVVIKSMWKRQIGSLSIEINDINLIWWTLCFPHVWDKMWSQSFTKRAAKNDIPFFWRRSLPIVKKNNTIQKVFTNFLQ